MAFEGQDDGQYLVLINEEEQYSLWPAQVKIPAGWRNVKEGTRTECASYVDEVWKDMRPLSLRRSMSARSA